VFQTLAGDDAVPPETIARLRGYAAAEAAEIAKPDYEGDDDGEQRICEQCAKTELQDGAWNGAPVPSELYRPSQHRRRAQSPAEPVSPIRELPPPLSEAAELALAHAV